jgi:cytochrome c
MRMKLLPTVAALAASLSANAAMAQDVEAGAAVFRKCSACHAAEAATNKVGPHLLGLFGRTAGTVEGFNYSKAMVEAGAGGLVWDEAALAEYLAAPRVKVPGGKMAFPGLKKPEDIQNVIAYLKSIPG